MLYYWQLMLIFDIFLVFNNDSLFSCIYDKILMLHMYNKKNFQSNFYNIASVLEHHLNIKKFCRCLCFFIFVSFNLLLYLCVILFIFIFPHLCFIFCVTSTCMCIIYSINNYGFSEITAHFISIYIYIYFNIASLFKELI